MNKTCEKLCDDNIVVIIGYLKLEDVLNLVRTCEKNQKSYLQEISKMFKT